MARNEMIFLKDYSPTPYRILDVSLTFAIRPDETIVTAELTLEPREGTLPGTPLVLDGDDLRFRTLAVDGAPVPLTGFETTPEGLTLNEPPHRRFVLETEVAIAPETNTKLMGLYRSNGTWCTQCEPEGFRRITYYYDRPDVLATFRVRIEADKALAPVLLSNGNPVGAGDLPGGRHFAIWHDPFPKPAYLFALVAGDLGSIHDSFTTQSGRKVALGIYCRHGEEHRCLFAMDSLKRAMAWDERRFGREYDLDIFNIVAVSDFNFGAMENKGLNIFNDKLVFADPETATDANYLSIERVIAHEYFHNWTGDRITCRDWFQLCLKEGLTVYRDQEFSMDERSRPVARIGEVQGLRQAQFPEDDSPLAHPPRPDRYREIENFYTATVYDKGAEVVRMLATLLGEAGFRKGMDLYFERHDGEATTIEAFIRCFEDSSGESLQDFQHWYTQAGTPAVSVRDHFDAALGTYTLEISQETRPTPDQPEKRPMVLPIRFGLLGPNGGPASYTGVTGAELRGDVLVVRHKSATITFSGLGARPVPSLFREFSAPVKLSTTLSEADQLFLARHDSDPFNRWQAMQDIGGRLLLTLVRGGTPDAAALDGFIAALEETLSAKDLDGTFKAQVLTLPGEMTIARALERNVDPDAVHRARRSLLRTMAMRLVTTLERLYLTNDSRLAYAPDFGQTSRRALKNTALSVLVLGGAPEAGRLAKEQYERALNMTDRSFALSCLISAGDPAADAASADFRARFCADPLVLDKWLAMVADAPHDDTIQRMEAILAEPDFPRNNPNRLRALAGTFGMSNLTQFARADGKGFDFLARFVRDVDGRNPQVAARVLTAFRFYPLLEATRRGRARAALTALKDGGPLSANVSELLDKMLAA